MKCTEHTNGTKTCSHRGRKWTFRPGKSNKAAKRARGKALHRKYNCTQNKRTGKFTSCTLRRGKR